MTWSLGPELDAVRAEAVEKRGRVTRMLLKTPEVRVAVVAIASGQTWPAHTASGRVVVRVEAGAIEIRAGDQRFDLRPGMLATLEPGVTHDVSAHEDSAFLLFVAGQDTSPSSSST